MMPASRLEISTGLAEDRGSPESASRPGQGTERRPRHPWPTEEVRICPPRLERPRPLRRVDRSLPAVGNRPLPARLRRQAHQILTAITRTVGEVESRCRSLPTQSDPAAVVRLWNGSSLAHAQGQAARGCISAPSCMENRMRVNQIMSINGGKAAAQCSPSLGGCPRPCACASRQP